ncbi:MAG TPA: hypothetical protein VFG37_03585 [Planctomycetota bacterium]|nr:hypothetical protein [Planctomycetota bacterium]
MDSPSHRPHSSAALAVAIGTAVVVGALVGGAYWLLGRSGDDEAAQRSGSAAKTRARDEARARSGSPADDASEGATRAPAEELADAGFPPCEPGPPDGLLVHVVAAADGSPVAGARVYVVPDRDRDSHSLFENALPFVEDPRRLAATHAHGFLADAQGEVRVALPAFDALLVGFSGERRGALRLFEVGRGSTELRLVRASDLVVQVVDAQEAPVRDACVALAARYARDATTSGGDDHWVPWVQYHEGARSDERGRARLIGADLAYARLLLTNTRATRYVLSAIVPYLGSPTARGAVDLGDPAALHGPVRVRLEDPFGGLEVRLVDAHGRIREFGGEVTFDANHPRGAYVYSSRLDDDGGSVQHRPIENGIARLLPVALGVKLEVTACVDGGATLMRTVDGPRAAGEVVRVDLDPERDRRVVRGRLVGLPAPLGPIVGMRGELQMTPGRPELRKDAARVAPTRFFFPVGVDARDDGAFEVDVSAHEESQLQSLRLRGFVPAHAFGFEATVALRADLVEPVTDVGDVAVVAIPILAAGRIVDDLRRPLANVDVFLAGERRGLGPLFSKFGPGTTSDAEGRFVLIGNVTGTEEKLLFVPPPGFATAVEEIPTDDRELEIALPRTGRIVGTVAADFDVTLCAAAHAPPSGGSALPRPTLSDQAFYARRETSEPGTTWAFTFELRPGRYDLLVSTTPNDPRSGVVAWVDDVEVRPAEVTVDPRLAPLTVVRARTAWRIHLSRSDGAPPPAAWVRVSPVDAPTEPWRTELVAAGEASFESALESAWIDVDAVSFRRVRELHGRGDVSIVLEPLEQRDVEIALDAGEAPHCYDLHWIVAADSSRPLPGFLRDNYSTTVVSGGTSRLSLDEGERWKVRLFAQIDAGGAPRRVELTRCMQEVSTRGDASETPSKLAFQVHADEVDALWQELSSSK